MRGMSTILLIIALLVVISTPVWGEEVQEVPVEKLKLHHVEWSDLVDKTAGGCPRAPAPEQNLYSLSPVWGCGPGIPGAPFPQNTFRYGVTGEVDATANVRDAYFRRLILDNVDLLVSVKGDPGNIGVWYEKPGPPGLTGCRWSHDDFDGQRPECVDDVDGVEIWGPQSADDADYYSLQGDPGNVSVFSMATGPYIPKATIVAAIMFLGWTGTEDSVDIDGLMVMNRGTDVWDTQDTIIFSIRKTGTWDGGEIVVLPFGVNPSFLNHGGHPWNTAFNVTAKFGAEDVDAIEASWWLREVPSLTNWGLIILLVLLVLSGIIVIRQRRRAAARA